MESEKDWLGSGSLSFLIWKDHAEILTPVVTKIWKLSLETYTYQVHGRVQITNFSQKLRPQGNNDFRGIDFTPVIARELEKVMYKFPLSLLTGKVQAAGTRSYQCNIKFLRLWTTRNSVR